MCAARDICHGLKNRTLTPGAQLVVGADHGHVEHRRGLIMVVQHGMDRRRAIGGREAGELLRQFFGAPRPDIGDDDANFASQPFTLLYQRSLLQSLRDRLSPERLPSLNLTAQPVAAFGAYASLQLLDWSTLIAGPKIFRADEPIPVEGPGFIEEPASAAPAVVSAIAEIAPANPLLLTTRLQLVRDIGRTKFRRKIWISLAAAEAIFLLVAIFKFQ